MRPLVSVVIPAYQAEMHIEAALSSVLCQTERDFEVLVINDGSTDRTSKIVRECPDDRVKLIELTRNSGCSYCRNLGIRSAAGWYVAFLDSDDVWEPNKLREQVRFMRCRHSLLSCTWYVGFGSREIQDDLRKFMNAKVSSNELRWRNPVGMSTVMVHRSIAHWLTFPIIDQNEDYACWIRLARFGIDFDVLPAVLSGYRVRDFSRSSNKLNSLKVNLLIWRNYDHAGPIDLVYRVFGFGIAHVMLFIRKKGVAFKGLIYKAIQSNVSRG